jgi:hypothetical protein
MSSAKLWQNNILRSSIDDKIHVKVFRRNKEEFDFCYLEIELINHFGSARRRNQAAYLMSALRPA